MTTCSRADAGAGSNYPFLTQKERDPETGLDYFLARYYAGTLGRFTSTDPLLASGRPANPQTWNRYAYVMNNPLRFVDPNGLAAQADHLEWEFQQGPQTPQQPATPPATQPSPQETVSATVNFWGPGEGANKGKGPVGHLSVEFSNGVYVSAWPLGGTGAAGTLLDLPAEVDFRHSYASDKKSYGRDADLRISIGNVDGASVNDYWAFIQKNPGQWRNGRNCADIVAEAISYAGVRLNNTQAGLSIPRETLYIIQRDARRYQKEPGTAPIWKSNYHSVGDLRRVYD